MLLETCAREGHAEAMLLLLDVYEGRFKGLDANREKAAHQARTLAESPSMDFKVNGGRGVRTESMYRLALYLEDGTGCPEDKQEAAVGVLSHDPRPSYQRKPGRIYGIAFAGFDIRFTVEEKTLTVIEVIKQ